MCTVCGCGQGETKIDGDHEHEHRHEDGTVHSHAHHHDGEHVHTHPHAPGGLSYAPRHHHHGHEHSHAPGLTPGRMVQIEQDILAKNNAYAGANRKLWRERGLFAINLVSSPGSGKTTLLVESIRRLAGRHPLAVIEGDQQTSNDAERIRATGARAIQVNTGKGCHLDAHMVGHAFERLDLNAGGLLLIENVGNLVCPAEFDLGEAHKVVILSVTEGEDKPLKYPNMFAASDLMLLTKTDLLPHLSFDTAKCIEYARRVNPKIEVMQVSAKSGEGMDGWLAWLEQGVASAKN
ncbi:MAG: hydrogenase nickel incorporation protein HypB [Betaproteobacteria bacterium]|nr:hydrogenase nickel incorporation protein HypB [Betaproteobacteria bacterium]